jgi:nicotinate-nucleotide adenylyltransferase
MFPDKEIELLFEIIKKENSISIDDLISNSRKENIVDARSIFSVIIKENFSDLSLRDIGQILGGRGHSTIINSIKRHNQLYESNKLYIENYNNINSKFLMNKIVENKISYSVRDLKYKKNKILNEIEREMTIVKKITSKNRNKELNVGLFIGSFNPVHNMHLVIANNVINNYDIDEVWFLFSDEGYEVKNKEVDLLNLKDRINLLKSGILDNPYFRLAKLNYEEGVVNLVSDSLREISNKYKNYHFSLIMGADYLYDIEKLEDYNYIKENYKIFYYERGGAHMRGINSIVRDENRSNKIVRIEGLLETNISSTKIRNILKENGSIDKLKYIMPDNCLYIIEEKKLYF